LWLPTVLRVDRTARAWHLAGLGMAMEINVEKLSPVLVEFKVELPADTVTKEIDSAFKQLARTARVRGFRKGKAPRHVIQQLYGPAVRADVAKRLVDSSLKDALKKQDVVPLTQPHVEPAELKSKQPFSYKARFEVRPEIEKVDWKGIEAERASDGVTDEQLDREIEQLRVSHSTMQPIEGRAAQDGDFASVTLSFEIGGEQQSQTVDIEVGAGKVLSEIDAALAGMNIGEDKTVDVTMPEDPAQAAMSGAEVAFAIKLDELKERVLPDVDDELAKDCEHDDLAAMKKALSEQIGERNKEQQDEAVARALVAKLCEKNPVPVPPSLVEQQARMSEQELRMMAKMTGQSLGAGQELMDRVTADAEMKVRAGLLMAEIAKEGEIKVDDADLEKGYTDLAEQTGKNVARIKAEYRDREKREMLIGMILEDKVLTLLQQEAKITEAK
jgi:trigger factor